MKIISDIKNVLGEICRQPGAAFYSHVSTLKPGKYLILGLNPGGDPSTISESIEKSLDDFQIDGYNAYFQPGWNKNGNRHRLQENLKILFNFLDYDLREVCATNLFFERSIDEKRLDRTQLSKYLETYKLILDVVKPQTIISFGVQPFYSVSTIFENDSVVYWEESAKHGNWKIRFSTGIFNGREIKLVGLPHLSIYTLYNRPDQMKLIKDFITRS